MKFKRELYVFVGFFNIAPGYSLRGLQSNESLQPTQHVDCRSICGFAPRLPKLVWSTFTSLRTPRTLAKRPLATDLILNNANSTIVAVSGIGDASGTEGAAAVGVGDSFSLAHDLAPNGGSASYVNEYTLVYDVFLPPSTDLTWRSLLQTTTTPDGNDGDYFVSSGNSIGVGSIGYSGTTVAADAWYRIVFAADLGDTPFGTGSFLTTVTDLAGASWTFEHSAQGLDGRHSLYSTANANIVHFFADDSGEDTEIHVSNLAVYDFPLTPGQAASLGRPGQAIASHPRACDHEFVVFERTRTSCFAPKVEKRLHRAPCALSTDGSVLTPKLRLFRERLRTNLAPLSIRGDAECTVHQAFTYQSKAINRGEHEMSIQRFLARSTCASALLTLAVSLAGTTQAQLVGLWEFEDGSDPTIASVGNSLILNNANATIVPVDGIDGAGGSDGAYAVGAGDSFIA